MKAHLYPSFQAKKYDNSRTIAIRILLGLLLSVAILGYFTLDIDHPFLLLDIASRALYVDEGFYADAAQNFKKFGQWDMPLDSRHWPGAPFMAFIQTIVFSIFGVSLSAARLISIGLSLLSILAFYFIARTRFTPLVSLGLCSATLLSFNYIGFSRAAIADPTASCMSMLALLAYVRIQTKQLAIPLSLVFAYLAFFSKMYFLFALATMVFLWGVELIVLPYLFKERIDRKAIVMFVISLLDDWALLPFLSASLRARNCQFFVYQ